MTRTRARTRAKERTSRLRPRRNEKGEVAVRSVLSGGIESYHMP